MPADENIRERYPPRDDGDRAAVLRFARDAPLVYGSWTHLKWLYKQLEDHYDNPMLWENAMSEHRAVLKAIAAHDAVAAKAAMQRHLNMAYKRFSKGWDALP